MAELDFTVRAALAELSREVVLPAVYDDLTPEQRRRAREQYARIQEGCCHYCHAPLDGPPTDEVMGKPLHGEYPEGFFNWPQHLHHDHYTGLTIGTVHSRCNAVLWEYHDE